MNLDLHNCYSIHIQVEIHSLTQLSPAAQNIQNNHNYGKYIIPDNPMVIFSEQ